VTFVAQERGWEDNTSWADNTYFMVQLTHVKLHAVRTLYCKSLQLTQKVLVKCRQNVANKLLITRFFNPVRPPLRQTDSNKCSKTTERPHMPKRDRGKLFLSVKLQNVHTILF